MKSVFDGTLPYVLTFPLTPSSGCIARVHAVGPDATTLKPGQLVLCDIGAPIRINADKLISKSKNSPFDGRRLQGQVLMTLVDGRVVHQAKP